jgi:hypothetical protein
MPGSKEKNEFVSKLDNFEVNNVDETFELDESDDENEPEEDEEDFE